MRRARRALAALAWAALALSGSGAQPSPGSAPAPTAQAQAAAGGSAPSAASSGAAWTGFAEARASLDAALKAGADAAAALEAQTATLAPADRLALTLERLRSLKAADARRFAAEAAGLALMLGRYSDAAEAYEFASTAPAPEGSPAAPAGPAGEGLDLLLRAARCRIASGELDRAEDLASLVLLKSASDQVGRARAVEARLVGAWALAARGRTSDAAAIAKAALQGEGAQAAGRLEARFLAWFCADDRDRAAAADALGAEFPGSPEALLAQGKASYVPAPYLYLGLLTAAGAEGAAERAGATAPAAAAPVQPASPKYPLQVGYFAKEENAGRLKAELRGKGFAAEVEKRTRTGSAEPRWIVVVEGGADPAATQKRLKEAGYESYPLE